MEKQRTEVLRSIAQHLILHTSVLKNIGLLNGKMGIVLFFFHYGKYIEKDLYTDFAGELIDEIYDSVYVDSPLYFKNGLTGIAWGIEYLIRNKFVDADPDEILEDLDKKILEWDVRRVDNVSLELGLTGLAHYVIIHCANRNRKTQIIPDDYISDLIYSLNYHMENANENDQIINNLKAILNG